MRMWILALSLSLAIGCTSVYRVDYDNDTRQVEVSNTCWLFLACLPIASGDVDNPSGWGCDWFSRTTTVENQMAMLSRESEMFGAKEIDDLVTFTTDEDCLLFVFVREKIHTMATLRK